MDKKKAIKAVVGAFAIGAVAIPLDDVFINRASEKTAIVAYESSSVVRAFSTPDFSNHSDMMYSDTNSAHIINDEMKFFISASKSFGDDIVDQFISLIQVDKEDDDSFEASNFIDRQYAINKSRCIKMIEKAFSIQSYRYAREVISAIRFSGLYYLDSWFKDLLLEGRRQPELASYISSLFDLYREELNAL